ncbi:hypothetical protein LshimejAT787_0506240 [Lyophyllum shimeji]|uniref:Uncharacterized protein n=1 Tax=Lyophyllum shimeji TaxID=47721 RepID=A0A9P3PNP3_LYOSH|nr:hypothetical protein LshimejAT787_0506240 [Lyophyllum shimeji]
MNPNLSQVSIARWFDVTPADLSLVANLPYWCPSATSVRISIQHRNAATVTSAAVLRWHTLSQLDVGSISKDAFLHIGTLPNLRFLSLPSLSALREIAIRSQHLSFCTQFLKLLAPRSPLFDITFVSLEPSLAGWTDLVNTITVTCCPSSLRSLEIRDYDELYSDSDVGHASKNLAVYGDTLKPLLTFSGVTHAQLAASHGFDFDDHFLEGLAVAWPRLQSLRVDTERKPDGLPRATLACLVSFARHCHHIEWLQLTVNARDIPASNPTGRIASNTLLTLGVGFSPISSPLKVAAFLSGVLPKLKRIIYYAANYGDESEEPDTSGLGWSEIHFFIFIHFVIMYSLARAALRPTDRGLTLPMFVDVRVEEATWTTMALTTPTPAGNEGKRSL